ncbi:MAG TPA: hypothetical protein VM889_02595 [Candidatus Thermoplasmatota archaeon]|nr:hypothetical protein [Candidatus Thermoplasmatota archaeon]
MAARKARRARAKSPAFPLAYVKYHDHCWLESKDLKSIAKAKPYVIEESGFLLQETPRFITLAKQRSKDGEKGRTQYEDVTIIMRSDILDMRTFGLAPAPRRRATRASRNRP